MKYISILLVSSAILISTSISYAASPSSRQQNMVKTKNVVTHYIKSVRVTYPLASKKPYFLQTMTGHLSKIVLPINEKVISISGADTINWQIAQTYYGTANKKTIVILIKPSPDAAYSQLYLTTNHKTYSFELVNNLKAKRYMSEISFSNSTETHVINNDVNRPKGYAIPIKISHQEETMDGMPIADTSALFFAGGSPPPQYHDFSKVLRQ